MGMRPYCEVKLKSLAPMEKAGHGSQESLASQPSRNVEFGFREGDGGRSGRVKWEETSRSSRHLKWKLEVPGKDSFFMEQDWDCTRC